MAPKMEASVRIIIVKNAEGWEDDAGSCRGGEMVAPSSTICCLAGPRVILLD